jgi:hypothetical protein
MSVENIAINLEIANALGLNIDRLVGFSLVVSAHNLPVVNAIYLPAKDFDAVILKQFQLTKIN